MFILTILRIKVQYVIQYRITTGFTKVWRKFAPSEQGFWGSHPPKLKYRDHMVKNQPYGTENNLLPSGKHVNFVFQCDGLSKQNWSQMLFFSGIYIYIYCNTAHSLWLSHFQKVCSWTHPTKGAKSDEEKFAIFVPVWTNCFIKHVFYGRVISGRPFAPFAN